MRTITGYGIAIIIFLASLNGIAWLQGNGIGARPVQLDATSIAGAGRICFRNDRT